MSSNVKISFEFFPPKTPEAANNLWPRVQKLASIKPEFMTVTYGAGGLNGEGTLLTIESAEKVRTLTSAPTGAHMTCMATPKDVLMGMADELWARGIKHIVALRGDKPKDPTLRNKPDDQYFAYAHELVSALKARHAFQISVGAYPEKHPEAPDLATDIFFLKQKCDAGADRAITQFFFENDNFFRFRDQAVAAGVTVDIIPGVLPIMNYDNMLRFANSCQAQVPDWLKARLEPIKNDPAAFAAATTDILAEQCEALVKAGATHLHFYSLNHDDLPYKACQRLGLVP
jgi:methylenetetrahydrofolate reductase (NADPH)